MTNNTLYWTIWFAASLILSPLLPGIINKVKAFFAGRKGPSVLQLYYDLFKLLRKESIVSTTSGGVIRLAPAIILGTLLTAALFLPYGAKYSPFTFTGDVIFFFYLLGTSRVAMIFGACSAPHCVKRWEISKYSIPTRLHISIQRSSFL